MSRSGDTTIFKHSCRPHLNSMNTPHTIAGAWTAVFAIRDGRWVIVQEHLSDVPARAEQQP